MTDRGTPRVGWIVVSLGVGALGVLGLYLVNQTQIVVSSDPGWGEVGSWRVRSSRLAGVWRSASC